LRKTKLLSKKAFFINSDIKHYCKAISFRRQRG